MTRGFAEMLRIATTLGVRAETLSGLSGFGDLVLTCTSTQSRNFKLGHALGANEPFDPNITVEGVATAKAVSKLAQNRNIEMPIAAMVTALTEHKISVRDAVEALLARPLKEE
jgi:glycerol-3-phosphate dehydrogenase (NAD(P)+)